TCALPISQRDAEHLLRLVLADHEAVKVRLDLARLQAEALEIERRFRRAASAALRGRVRLGPAEAEDGRPREALAHELIEAALHFLRRHRLRHSRLHSHAANLRHSPPPTNSSDRFPAGSAPVTGGS